MASGDESDDSVIIDTVERDDEFAVIELREGLKIPRRYCEMPALIPLIGLMSNYHVDSYIIADTLTFIDQTMDNRSINVVLDEIADAMLSGDPISTNSEDEPFDSNDARLGGESEGECGPVDSEEAVEAEAIAVKDAAAKQAAAKAREAKEGGEKKAEGKVADDTISGKREENGKKVAEVDDACLDKDERMKRPCDAKPNPNVKRVKIAAPMQDMNRVEAAIRWRKLSKKMAPPKWNLEGPIWPMIRKDENATKTD